MFWCVLFLWNRPISSFAHPPSSLFWILPHWTLRRSLSILAGCDSVKLVCTFASPKNENLRCSEICHCNQSCRIREYEAPSIWLSMQLVHKCTCEPHHTLCPSLARLPDPVRCTNKTECTREWTHLPCKDSGLQSLTMGLWWIHFAGTWSRTLWKSYTITISWLRIHQVRIDCSVNKPPLPCYWLWTLICPKNMVRTCVFCSCSCSTWMFYARIQSLYAKAGTRPVVS